MSSVHGSPVARSVDDGHIVHGISMVIPHLHSDFSWMSCISESGKQTTTITDKKLLQRQIKGLICKQIHLNNGLKCKQTAPTQPWFVNKCSSTPAWYVIKSPQSLLFALYIDAPDSTTVSNSPTKCAIEHCSHFNSRQAEQQQGSRLHLTDPSGIAMYSYLALIPDNVGTSPTSSFLSCTSAGFMSMNWRVVSIDFEAGFDICWFPNSAKVSLSTTPTWPTCSSGWSLRCRDCLVLTRLNSPSTESYKEEIWKWNNCLCKDWKPYYALTAQSCGILRSQALLPSLSGQPPSPSSSTVSLVGQS